MFIWTSNKIDIVRKNRATITARECCKTVGCSLGQLRYLCKKMDWSFKKHGEHHHSAKTSNEDIELMRTMRDDGFSISSISKKFGKSHDYTYQIVEHLYRNQDHV